MLSDNRVSHFYNLGWEDNAYRAFAFTGSSVQLFKLDFSHDLATEFHAILIFIFLIFWAIDGGLNYFLTTFQINGLSLLSISCHQISGHQRIRQSLAVKYRCIVVISVRTLPNAYTYVLMCRVQHISFMIRAIYPQIKSLLVCCCICYIFSHNICI